MGSRFQVELGVRISIMRVNFDKVFILSILYLVLPYFIFAAGWLSLPVALLLTLLLLYSIYKIIVDLFYFPKRIDPTNEVVVSRRTIALVVSISCIWTLLSGAIRRFR